jgi:hypothetical protein
VVEGHGSQIDGFGGKLLKTEKALSERLGTKRVW